MHGWTVDFVNEAAAEEFLALPLDMGAKMVRTIDFIKEHGLHAVGMPLVRPVEGGLWEIRGKGRDGIARSLYVTATGRRVIILRTFIKKTEKTPRREIELALVRLKEVEP